MTIKVRLRNATNLFALVDEEDYTKIQGYRWLYKPIDNKLYAVTDFFRHRQCLYMHHFILPLLPGLIVDHCDGNGLNNQKHNLRRVTNSQNLANSQLRKDNTSGYKGVSLFVRRGKWVATITCDGERHHLGYFLSAYEAAKAYDKKAWELFGPHAKLNFPGSAVQ